MPYLFDPRALVQVKYEMLRRVLGEGQPAGKTAASSFFTSDQLSEYEDALLHTYGTRFTPVRKDSRGRPPFPRLIPAEDLLYAQVVKVRDGGRLIEVKTKTIFGKPDVIAAQLANSPMSDAIITSFVERDNLTQRQIKHRLMRKTNGFSKDLGWFEKQLWLTYHLVLPHLSLRQAIETPQPTCGTGTPKKWEPVTPAMAAGITDHFWSSHELLSYRVPARSWINCQRTTLICLARRGYPSSQIRDTTRILEFTYFRMRANRSPLHSWR